MRIDSERGERKSRLPRGHGAGVVPAPCRRRSRVGQEGYILIAVLFMAALVLLMLSLAAPKMAAEIERDREVELMHRGMQYRRAIQLYYRKFGSYPPNIEALEKVNQIRFLRKRYLDPETGKDEWKLIHYGENKLPTVWGFFGQPMGGTGGSTLAGTGPGGVGQSLGAGMQSAYGNSNGQFGGNSSGGSNFGGSSFGSSGGGSSFGGSSFGGGSGSSFGSSFGGSSGGFQGNSGGGFGSSNGGSSFGASSNGGSSGGSSNGTTGSNGSSDPNSGNSGDPNSAANGTNGTNGTSGTNGSSGSTSSTGSTFSTNGQTFGGGGIIGVESTSPKTSILEYRKKKHFNEWEFTYDPMSERIQISGNTGTIGQPMSGAGAGSTSTFGPPNSINPQGTGNGTGAATQSAPQQ